MLEGDRLRWERSMAALAWFIAYLGPAMTAAVANGIGVALSKGRRKVPKGPRVEDVFRMLPGVRPRERKG